MILSLPTEIPVPLSPEFRLKLRTSRRESGCTLSEIAGDCRCSSSTLLKIESGERRPSLDLLLRLTRRYGLACDAVLRIALGENPALVQLLAPEDC